MLYALLCYNDEAAVCAWTQEQDDAVMAKLGVVHERLAQAGQLGPSLRLMPTTTATTLVKNSEPPVVIDGPYAETKEALLGFYILDCVDLEEALEAAKELAKANPGGAYEIRPVRLYLPRELPGRALHPMNELAWIDAALTAARPQAVAALLRYFRDLDSAEEAFQNACLRALKAWPQNGPPRDAAAWLIFVGRNSGIDAVRRRSKETVLPAEDLLSDLDDAEAGLVERLDGADYRDDILRLMFICCHPDLPAAQQVALALRIVSGLSVSQIARAFLVSEAAMEQRITRAKARIAKAEVPFETPGAADRSERLGAVAAMVYLVFNEGYSAADDPQGARLQLCEEAIRLGRLLLRLFNAEPEIMGLTALMLLQHARAAARFDNEGAAVLLEDQDRTLWSRDKIAEGLALLDKAMRHRRPGAYQVQAAIAALHARAARAEDTDWAGIEALYGALERHQPSPVVSLNRAVAVAKSQGPAQALEMIEPLADRLSGYFYYYGVKGWLLKDLGRPAESREAFNRAIALSHTATEAAHIRAQIDSLTKNTDPPVGSATARTS